MCRIAACGFTVPQMRVLLAPSQEGSFVAEISLLAKPEADGVPLRRRSENGFCRNGLQPTITLACMVLLAEPMRIMRLRFRCVITHCRLAAIVVLPGLH
jgi:hypothetical protein